MHAFLLVGREITNYKLPITNLAAEQQAKLLPFAMQRIEDSRELKKLVKFVFNEKTAIVIENIDNATPEAANAFLKNLEEPTKNIIYILTANNLSNVLPTIVSRCQVVKIANHRLQTPNKLQITDYKDALNIKDREEAIKFVENLIYIDYEKNNFKNMDHYLSTIKNLKLNGNVALQMTNLVVTMNRNA